MTPATDGLGLQPLEHSKARAVIGAHFEGRSSPAAEAAMRAHLSGCRDCRDFYKRHHLLSRLDPAALPPEQRIARALGFRPRRAGAPLSWVRKLALPTLATAVAAAAVLLVVRPAPNSDLVARGTGAMMVQTPRVLLYRFAPGGRTPELVRGSMGRGDELAFAYTNPAGRRYVAIFGVDETRRVYWFHPAWREGAPPPVALPAAAGPGPHELPEAIRHSIEGRRLVVHGLFADRAVGVGEVEAAVRGGASGVSLVPRLGGNMAVVERAIDVSP